MSGHVWAVPRFVGNVWWRAREAVWDYNTRRRCRCLDCRRNTGRLREFYMVHDDAWEQSGAGDGVLCIGCLERRIGRRLVPADFTDVPINHDVNHDGYQSPRLLSRLSAESDDTLSWDEALYALVSDDEGGDAA